jgi:hypothetical protein
MQVRVAMADVQGAAIVAVGFVKEDGAAQIAANDRITQIDEAASAWQP